MSPIALGAGPSAEEALSYPPGQADVEYDVPAKAAIANCTIKTEKNSLVVRGPNGEILRKFTDTNSDRTVDQWSFYQNGIEVYRDIDTNFDKKVDQSRWLNTAGSRWGVDKNADGIIDGWLAISAEEASAEVVAAVAKGEVHRFKALLPTKSELKSITDPAANSPKLEELSLRLGKAVEEFEQFIKKQEEISPDTKWTQFSAGKPGIVPADSEGMASDVLVYENAMAITETGKKSGQLQIGSMIKIGDAWRIVSAPSTLGAGGLVGGNVGGLFFNTSAGGREEGAAGAEANAAYNALTEALEKLDKEISNAQNEKEIAKLTEDRIVLMEKLANASTDPQDRVSWIKQLADVIGTGASTGQIPNALDRLDQLHTELAKNAKDQDTAAYVRFRALTAWYDLESQANPNFQATQTEWIKKLMEFVQLYPKTSETPEALLQLAISQEFSGDSANAAKVYGQIAAEFPQAPVAAKATGAQTRLDSIGKTIALKGKTLQGEKFDLAKLKGKVVLIHYWSSSNQLNLPDIAVLKNLNAKYAAQGFEIVGVSLDDNAEDLAKTVKSDKIAWTQVWEEGGTDSRLANEMGIMTVPTMLLLDTQGHVINRNIHVRELEREIRNILK